MGFLDSVKAWLKTEAVEARRAKGDLETRLDDDLARREHQLNETPEQALERLQHEVADSESSFETISKKIDEVATKASAGGDLANVGADQIEADEIEADEIEAESEEVELEIDPADLDRDPG
jgi:chromosome segregation ATPase